MTLSKELLLPVLLAASLSVSAQQAQWPEVKTEAKPAARWWWLGSAVDKANITYNMEEYARAGMGGLEITPIYGVKGNDANNIDYLSPQWMDMLSHTLSEGKRLGIKVDMNNGTGWPFGGPEVSIEDAATKVFFQQYELKGGERLAKTIEVDDAKQKPYARLSRLMAYSDGGKKLDITTAVGKDGRLNWTAPAGNWRLIAVFNGKTLQQVKRAAPGGQGYVMNHFSAKAVQNYLGRFDKAFTTSGAPYPNSFFNDSYEVYKADWTPDLFEQFRKRRGYKLEDYLPEFLANGATDTSARIRSDYRETLAELLLENFTRQWTAWAHRHGSTTRNQAHGSPGNLIDLYATVDIPECESFGISDFGIRRFRQDSIRKKNDSDLSMLKYASSAAHLTGKPYTSSETFTWLTDHFRTSLAQCKPDLDLFFISGVNHVFFHGTTYSPREAEWPGWKFYASVDMSPNNTIWRDAPEMFRYITRCQSFLQMGQPDNDFLVYLPVYDMWYKQSGRMLMFDIHGMAKRAPKFIDVVHKINNSGYDVDYISDRFILSSKVENGLIKTVGGTTYKALVVPAAERMPVKVLNHLIGMIRQGAKVVFMEKYPQDVPGFGRLEQRKTAFGRLAAQLPAVKDFGAVQTSPLGKGTVITGSDYSLTLDACGVNKEEIKTVWGAQALRRKNATGYHYFVSDLSPRDIDGWVTLGVDAEGAVIYDPMSGETGAARVRRQDGKTQVYLQLKSGASLILQTYTKGMPAVDNWKYYRPQALSLGVDQGWKLSFVASDPAIEGEFAIDTPRSWTELDIPEAKVNKGTGRYHVRFTLPEIKADEWLLDLGDVYESARVRLNGKEVATVWAVPMTVRVGQYLRPGENLLEVEVTNLPANRIADYDRRGVEWRRFNEINVVNLFYKKDKYDKWTTVPSGLVGPVRLIPLTTLSPLY